MKKVIFLLLYTVLSTVVFAQEVCNNGLDDDGDGFIDCYDPDCSSHVACEGIFLGNDVACPITPSAFPKFTMGLDFSSPNETTNHLSRMSIGDLNRDGIPEIVTMNRYTNTVFILNGNNGTVQRSAVVNFEPYWEVAIGNLNNDACGEIFFIGYQDPPGVNNNGVYIFAYDCMLNFLWQTAQPLRGDPINYGLTDFDGDGLIELYAKDEIYDAHTGVRLVKSTAASYTNINGGPVAADIVGDTRQELILGLSIYQVNLGTRTLDAGSLTLLSKRNEYFIRNEYNATSIADYNQDGFLDVIASGSTTNNNVNTTVFFWDVKNNVLLTYRDLTGAYAPNGWKNGTGRINIADLDGDGKLNVSYVSGKYLYALNENFQLLWRIVINEETSGYTGCTLFDFNGDGKSEIVYRDEQYLYILDGTNGAIFNQQTCVSRTNREYPIVADVDADGSTELCVTCGFDDVLAKANFNTLSYSRYSHVRVYKSASEPWVPARRLWNQHGYFIVNVNDDLTIPKIMQKHHLVFSSGSCTTGPNRPLNKFLNQAPYLNSQGCPSYAGPDLVFQGIPTVKPPVCPSLNYLLSFQFKNIGEVAFTGTLPISFYTSNPKKAGATKLKTLLIPVNNLPQGGVFSVVDSLISGVNSDSLYFVLNDAGTSIPTPITLPNTPFLECNYDNIYGIKVAPLPVALTALEVNPNELCSALPNGAVRAFVPMAGGIENTVDYDFYWSMGAVAKPMASADFIGPIYTGIPNGVYTVYAVHKTAKCQSVIAQATVNPLNSFPTVSINIISPQTQCNPPNGQLEALVAGGNSGYTFEWFNNSGSIGVTTSLASNLKADNYTVSVKKGICQSNATAIVQDLAIEPDAFTTATPIVNCQNLLSGTVTGQVQEKGVVMNPVNYDFNWFQYNNVTGLQSSPLSAQYGTGPNRSGLPAGWYQLIIVNKNTQCASLPNNIEVATATVLPTVTFNQLAAQTSCDPLNPNGRLEAVGALGGVNQPATGFTFEWFVGQNTLPANVHTTVSGINGSMAEKVKGGGQAYTVKITTPFQCSAVKDTVINQILTYPLITLIPTPNSICDPLLTSPAVQYNGAVAATINNPVGPLTDYVFKWTNEPVNTVIAGATSSTLSQRNNGTYGLVVTHTATACPSVLNTAIVLPTKILPVITANAIASTNCAPALANGTAQVTNVVSGTNMGTGVPFAFKWYSGNMASGAVLGTAPVLANRQGGVGNFYTVLVTNQKDGCQNTFTVELPDARVIPALSLVPTPNTICDPLLTSPAVQYNGSVTATVTNPVGLISDYVFKWTNEPAATTIAGVTGTILLQQNNGTYGATATHVPTGCISPLVTAQVLPVKTLPSITANAIPSTNCDPALANGTVQVTNVVSGAYVGTGVPFAFKWYSGITASGTVLGTNPVLGNQQGGSGVNFTVLVTNQKDGCQNTSTVQLSDNRAFPIITVSATDNTICVGTPNGTATLASLTYKGAPAAAPYTGYTFTWSNTATTSSINSLPASSYILTVKKTDVGCVSAPVTAIVDDNLFIPPINTTVVNQTSCDNLSPNGILTATINEAAIGGIPVENSPLKYSFAWTNHGNPLVLPGTGVTTTTAINGQVNKLSGNLFYSVVATRLSTGCTNSANIFLPETITLPVVVAAVSGNVTRCDTPNGSIQANVGGTQVGYSFYWLNEVGQAQTTDPAVILASPTRVVLDNGAYPNLIPGNYTVLVKNNFTSCLSQPITKSVLDNTLKSNITITLGPSYPSTCGVANGQMSATVSGGAGGPFNLAWHKTAPINADPNINFFTNPPQFSPPNNIPFNTATGVTSSNVSGVSSDLYTLLAVDQSNGCSNYQTTFLPFANAHTINAVLTPSTICPSPGVGGNGKIDVSISNIPSVPPGLTIQDFTYYLYEGQSPLPAKQLGVTIGPGAGVTNPVPYTVLAAGFYTVEVRQNFSSNCPVYQVVEIKANALPPVVDIVGTLKANTSCDPVNSADGQATISINKNAMDLTTGFTYSIDVNPTPLGWALTNKGPYPPSILPETLVIGGLSPNTSVPQYTVTVTSSNNCVSQRFISIPDQPLIPQLNGNVAIVDANLCTPSGSVQVTAINAIGGGADPELTNIGNYQFTWFDNASYTPANGIFQAQGNSAPNVGQLLNNGSYPAIGPGLYYIVADKTMGTKGMRCKSAPMVAEIKDVSAPPVFALSPLSNTSCDNIFEGSIKLTVSNAGSVATPSYTYTWDPANPAPKIGITLPVTGNGDGLGVDENTVGLNDGSYKVTVKNDVTGCATVGQTIITRQNTPIIVAGTTVVDQDICKPDGSIGVTSIQVNAVNDPVFTNYDFTWYRNDPTSVPIINQMNNTPVLGTANYPTMGAGTYFVKVKRLSGIQPGSGCESVPVRVDVKDISVNPTFTMKPFSNTACDIAYEGSIKVNVTNPGSAPTSTYTYNWAVSNPAPLSGITVLNNNGDGLGPDGDYPVGLRDGTYSMEVTNDASGCKTTGQTVITRIATPIIVTNANVLDQMICNPDGSISVTNILVSGVVDPVHANFDFTWYRNDPTSVPIINQANGTDVLNKTSYPTIGAGTYYMKVKRAPGIQPGSGCESAPLRKDILDLSVVPQLMFAITPNTSCNPANPNGAVIATASERNGTTGTYTFGWTYSGGTLPAATTQTDLNPKSTLGKASQGTYVASVFNTLTGCTYSQGTEVVLALNQSLPNIVNVNTIDPADCNPTGSAQVVEISIGGVTQITNPLTLDANFDYAWYKANYPANLLPGQVTRTLANQFPDTYFVEVRDLTTDCKSSPVEVVISTKNIVYPVVSIQQTSPQVSCNVGIGTGTLVATGDGQNSTNPNYAFTWYPSLDLTGNSFANTSTVTGLTASSYSVNVLNTTTNCKASGSYIVVDEAMEYFPQLALSSNALTECDSIDGSVSAQARPFPIDPNPVKNYPFAYQYIADLYLGNPPANLNNPEFPNMPKDMSSPMPGGIYVKPNLLNGMYTVRLTDVNTGCSTIDTVSVKDKRIYPKPTVVPLAPVTNCDPLNPNGVARASVNGNIVGYIFDWHEGTVIGTPVYSGVEYSHLKPLTYTVNATNAVTGCSGNVQVIIDNRPNPIPAPTIEVWSDVTSCVSSNGILASSVNGNTKDFVFDWYNGNVESPPSVFIGEIYSGLAAGTYSVTATNRLTGCKSELKSKDVQNKQVYPEFEFQVENSSCNQSDGFATLFLTTEVTIESIVWTNANGLVAIGPNLMNALPDRYMVTVTTALGCTTDKEVEISTDIRPYNGISRNKDGQNEYFHIDCLQNFPDNVVKIYNRAGTLVYEEHGYNNIDLYFDGRANRGVSPMGNNLPDGTYFYVINKMDGSKPIAGYLEIVN